MGGSPASRRLSPSKSPHTDPPNVTDVEEGRSEGGNLGSNDSRREGDYDGCALVQTIRSSTSAPTVCGNSLKDSTVVALSLLSPRM